MTDEVGVVSAHQLADVLKDTATLLGARCGLPVVRLFATRLTACIGSPQDDRHSYIWRSAVEKHEQDEYKDDYRSVLVDALRDSTLSLVSTDSTNGPTAVEMLLTSSYPTLARIGIFLCGIRYKEVGALFWKNFRTAWLHELPYWHELFWFIRNTYSQYSEKEKLRFIEAVRALEGDWRDKELQEQLDEQLRRDLLHPAVGLGDERIDQWYAELVQAHGPVREHVDFHAYSTSGWRGDSSPATADFLAGASDLQLAELMGAFQPSGNDLDAPTYGGFAQALAGAVRASEDGFKGRLALFNDVDRPFQHGVLRGLKERWSEDRREIDWDGALALMLHIVESEKFRIDLMAEVSGKWEPNIYWVISDTADLIKSAVADKAPREIDTEDRYRCIEILRAILRSSQPASPAGKKDAVSAAINSPRGRSLEALINVSLSLRRAEVASAFIVSPVWEKVGPIFEGELVSSEVGKNAEFATFAGMYCGNLHFLSAEWVEKNFDRLFSLKHDGAWQCAAQGFAYQHYLYEWLYARLNQSDHLTRMLRDPQLPDKVSDRALQFVGLAYLEGLEKLGWADGLFSRIVSEMRGEEISRLAWFFWTLRDRPSRQKFGPAILAFWEKVSATLRAGEQVPEIQSALNLLAEYIDEVTPAVTQMWAEAAPFAQMKHHGYVLVQHLNRLASAAPEAVCRVFKAALAGFLPDYKKEDVTSCVQKIAAAGYVDEAEWICNEYAKRGATLLNETYQLVRKKVN